MSEQEIQYPFLVTGGAGFIGFHLCQHLLSQGHQVLCIDNFDDFYDPQIKARHVEQLSENFPQTFQCLKQDIRDAQSLSEAFAQFKPKLVIHLAAKAGVRKSIEEPLEFEDVNVRGTLNVLEACRTQGVKRLIYGSSSSVYGNGKLPFSEQDRVDHPISPYAATKRAAEILAYTYAMTYGLRVAALRFFTVYGPHQRPDLVIHKFSKKIIDEQAIPFYGDGQSERDYTYIGDVVQGLTGAITWLLSAKEKKYEAFNLGASEAVTLKDLLALLEQTLGQKAKIDLFPTQDGDVFKTASNNSKARMFLGYQPQVSLKQGLKNFVDWFLKEYEVSPHEVCVNKA